MNYTVIVFPIINIGTQMAVEKNELYKVIFFANIMNTYLSIIIQWKYEKQLEIHIANWTGKIYHK